VSTTRGLRQSPVGSDLVYDKSADFRRTDLSVQFRHVGILPVGLVGSQTKSVGRCSGI